VKTVELCRAQVDYHIKCRARSKENSMARVYRSTTAAVLACLIVAECTSTLLASDAEGAAPPAISHLTYNGKPLTALGPWHDDHVQAAPPNDALAVESTALGQYGGFRRGGRRRNEAAATALFLGAAGTIAGAAVLVYANRPECRANPALNACGYGTKVVGGAVLSAGLVGLMIGALTWR